MLVTIFGSLGILAITALCVFLLVDQRKATSTLRETQVALQKAQNAIPEAKEAAERKYRFKYLEDVSAFKERVDTEHNHLISQAVCSQSAGELVGMIGDTVNKHCSRSTQEFLGNISDEAEGLTRDLQFALCDQIWDSFQQYKEKLKDTPYLIPQNVRLMYTKGKRTVLIVEQKPQVRTVGFSRSLVAEADLKHAVTKSRQGYWFALAFPYVYFIISFDDGRYSVIEPFFSNQPITSVRDQLHLAPLPNVKERDSQSTRHLCMGNGTSDVLRDCKTITEQAEALISLFWSRVYSTHYGKGKFRKVDKRLGTIRRWQHNSQEDPLFILTVEWKNGKTVKGLVEERLEWRQQDHDMDGAETAVRELLDSGVKTLTNRIKEEIKSVQESQAPKHLDSQARDQLETVLTSHTKNVFAACKG
jgi:hypothetical protein